MARPLPWTSANADHRRITPGVRKEGQSGSTLKIANKPPLPQCPHPSSPVLIPSISLTTRPMPAGTPASKGRSSTPRSAREGKGTGNRDHATGRKANPVTAVLGPRQAGKSTLVRHSLVNQIKTLILDLDLPSDLRRMSVTDGMWISIPSISTTVEWAKASSNFKPSTVVRMSIRRGATPT
jgi:hypothetical protein